MALIHCPNCGKNVSDTAEKCVHCGHGLKKEHIANRSLETKPEFSTLPQEKQKRLTAEFNSLFCKQAVAYNKRRVYFACCILSWVFLVLAVVLFVCYITFDINAILWTTLVAALIMAILLIGTRVFTNPVNRIYVNYVKTFSQWLNECKGIANNVIVDKKIGRLYNETNVSEADLQKIAELKSASEKLQ